MRRFSALLFAALLAWAGLRLAGAEGTPTPSLLRDALLLALPVLLIGAWQATAWHSPPRNERAWPHFARALLAAGLVTAVAGAVLSGLGGRTGIGLAIWAVGLLLSVAAAIFPGRTVRYAPPAFLWKRDAQGELRREPADRTEPVQGTGRLWWPAAALILIAGAGLRLWLAAQMPPVCQMMECLAVPGAGAELSAAPTSLPANLLLLITNDPLWALRLAQALLSVATLALFPLALRDLLSPGGRLLGMALLAFNPWSLRLLTGGVAGHEIPLLILLLLEASATALTRPLPRVWIVAGAALGLLFTAAPLLASAWLLWLVLLLLLAASRPLPRTWKAPAALLASAAAASAPYWLTRTGEPFAGLSLLPAPELIARATALATWALQPGALWMAALAVVGAGAALHYGVRALAIFSGLVALLLLFATPQAAPLSADRAWLALSPWAALFAAIACDQLFRAVLRAWGTTATPRAPVFAAAGLLFLFSAPGLYALLRTPQTAVLAADDKIAVAVIDHVRALDEEPASANVTLLVQPGVLNHPAVRTALAANIQQGRMIAFSPASDLLPELDPPGDVIFLLPTNETATLRLLAAAWPRAATRPLVSEGAALTEVRIAAATFTQSRGLEQYLYPGDSFGSADEAQVSQHTSALQFGWQNAPPAPLPFAAEWQGALIVREAGSHLFSVQSPPGSIFSLQLDGRLVLDSSAGLLSRSEELAAGIYQLEMRFRSGPTPGDLLVFWQPPGGPNEVIPATVLHNPPLPNQGLLGIYTPGLEWAGDPLFQRKDLLLEADATLSAPWSVQWQGQIAASRAGEYLFGAASDGTLLVDIGGRRVLNRLPADDDTPLEATSEGTVYLQQGWHPVTIRYATEGPLPTLKLYWQTPGNGPLPLDAAFLVPALGRYTPADLPLPTLPPAEPALGDDSFALSGDVSFWQTTVFAPPDEEANALDALPFERLWSVGSCGAEITQFAYPHGVAFDAERRLLLVADTGNRRVLLLELDDGLPSLAGFAEMEEPVDVAVSPQGEWLALDTVAPRILRYNLLTDEAGVIALSEGFYRPRGLAVDVAGMLYLADTGGARVAVVDRSGTVAAQFGGPGSPLGNGQPVDVVATGRALWVIAAESGRLWQLDTLGSITALPRGDTIDGPHLAALGPEGGLFLSDPSRSQILYLSARGQPLGVLSDVGAFQRPTGIDVLRDGDDVLLAVSDTTACSVSLWRARAANLP